MNAFKTELISAFAEVKNNPSTLLKKPETSITGNWLAAIGFTISLFAFILLAAFRESIVGLIGLFLGLGAMFFSALGLKTEGRSLATGGSILSLFVVVFALINIFGSSPPPPPGPTPIVDPPLTPIEIIRRCLHALIDIGVDRVKGK